MANEIDEKLIELRRQSYNYRQQVTSLARLVYELGQSDKLPELIAAQKVLESADKETAQAEMDLRQAAVATTAAPIKVGAPKDLVYRSMETTGVEVQLLPRMDFVPTAYYHLFDPAQDPLVQCVVRTVKPQPQRLRITAYIDGYTARAVQTIEVKVNEPQSIFFLPTLFPEKARNIQELTRATLNVLAEDLGKNNQVELHETRPIWLLSRNSATFEIDDPANPDPSKRVKDFRHYLGAFVTPNHPRVQGFLREAAGKHFEEQLAGDLDNVSDQVSAIYTALKENVQITYVNASLAFNPRVGAIGQRVRLPHECLEEKQANCLDGALLFASLLEAIGLDVAIVLASGHAVVGWRVGKDPDIWSYVDTTLIHSHDFWPARDLAIENVIAYQKAQAETGVEQGARFRQLVLNELRSKYGVTPLA